MKKTYQRLPESELDIMLVLWNNNFVIADQIGEQKFRGSDETGKNESVYTPGFAVRLSGT